MKNNQLKKRIEALRKKLEPVEDPGPIAIRLRWPEDLDRLGPDPSIKRAKQQLAGLTPDQLKAVAWAVSWEDESPAPDRD